MTTNIPEKESDLGVLWLFKEKCGFTQIPSNIAYESYFKAMLVCANGDGTLADEERDWVVGCAYAYDCDPALIEELKVYKADEDIETVISRDPAANESRFFLIFDAMQVCCADGEYSDKERAVILKGAKKLNVSEEEFKKIEELYLETVKLREKRIALLYPQGAPL